MFCALIEGDEIYHSNGPYDGSVLIGVEIEVFVSANPRLVAGLESSVPARVGAGFPVPESL